MPCNQFSFRRWRAGEVAVPIFLITSGAILLLSNFEIIAPVKVQDLWPLLLISIGIENLVARKWRTHE